MKNRFNKRTTKSLKPKGLLDVNLIIKTKNLPEFSSKTSLGKSSYPNPQITQKM